MLLLFFITASVVWHLVLAFFMIRDIRLLLKIIRWAVFIYLILFGLFIGEVLREGLVVNGAAILHWDVRLVWAVWFWFVVASVTDWRVLVPTVAFPVYILSFPETRTLLNYGLVRLGWLDLVYSPVSFAVGRGGGFLQVLRVGERVDDMVEGVVRPMAGVIQDVLGSALDWAPWIGPDMEKLKTVEPWNGFVLRE